jgi:eukaryotic-like serine/threonine-protein kinase
MDHERRKRIEDLFEAALDRQTAQRGPFLEEACTDDPGLLAEVRAMLAAHELAEHLFDEVAEPIGRRIGPYGIIREIGRGGMGTVYLAERADGQYRRRVAIKLIATSNVEDPLHQRFLAERQILAGLDHPKIARLLDGGVTEDGRPYLVLDHVDGLPITTYCDRQRLGVDERLHLFMDVCAAVQHAHQNLVIHRDIKPSNILVTPAGEVRLLDFGIAKLLNPALSGANAPVTRFELRAMTPEYASPEQVRGDSITTATDIYSLGVLLYELLTGSPPYRLGTHSPAEILQAVCERDPERPSTRVTRVDTVLGQAGVHEEITPERRSTDRNTSVERLQRRLQGDLDSIVLMAMRKEPGRRYPSADLLRQDLQRYQEGLPVLAHRGSRRYRLGKFVRRHRPQVVTTGLVFLALLIGTGVVSREATIASRERDRAEQERLKAQRVADFLESLFAAGDPYALSPERLDTLRVRDLLRGRLGSLTDELGDQPIVQAQLLDVVGRVHRNLGLYEEAKMLLRQAVDARRRSLDARHPDLARSLANLASLLIATGEFEEAQRLLEEARVIEVETLGASHPQLAVVLNLLGAVRRELGFYREAEAFHRQAIDMLRVTAGERDPRLAEFLAELVTTLEWEGEFEAAQSYAQESVALHRRLFGDSHPATAQAMREAGLILQRLGNYAAAETNFRSAYEIARRTHGDEHPQIADLVGRLASVRYWQRDYEVSDSLHLQAIAMLHRFHGPVHVDIAYALNNRASTLRELKRFAAADSAHLAALDIARRLLGEEHAAFWILIANHASTYVSKGECGVAESLLRESSAGMKRTIPTPGVRLALNQALLGECLFRSRRFEEAESLLLASYSALAESRQGERFTHRVADQLASLYQAWGRPEKAVAFRRPD